MRVDERLDLRIGESHMEVERTGGGLRAGGGVPLEPERSHARLIHRGQHHPVKEAVPIGAGSHATHSTGYNKPVESPIQAVLFDMDGVLLDSFEAWYATVLDACRHFGDPPVSRETFRKLFGAGSDTDVASFLPGATSAEADRFYAERFPLHMDLIRPFPEAPGVLRALAQAGIRTACVTNTTRDLARRLLGENGLRAALEAVVTADDVARPKPAPDMVTKALSDLSVEASRGLLVGDTVYDLEAARSARCIGVGFKIDGGDRRIERLAEVLELVRQP